MYTLAGFELTATRWLAEKNRLEFFVRFFVAADLRIQLQVAGHGQAEGVAGEGLVRVHHPHLDVGGT
jgi:hypothetical protein